MKEIIKNLVSALQTHVAATRISTVETRLLILNNSLDDVITYIGILELVTAVPTLAKQVNIRKVEATKKFKAIKDLLVTETKKLGELEKDFKLKYS